MRIYKTQCFNIFYLFISFDSSSFSVQGKLKHNNKLHNAASEGSCVKCEKTRIMIRWWQRDLLWSTVWKRWSWSWWCWSLCWPWPGGGRTRDENIRGSAQVEQFGDRVERLRWWGHAQRRDYGYTGQRILKMELPGGQKRRRPPIRFMDVVKADMQICTFVIQTCQRKMGDGGRRSTKGPLKGIARWRRLMGPSQEVTHNVWINAPQYHHGEMGSSIRFYIIDGYGSGFDLRLGVRCCSRLTKRMNVGQGPSSHPFIW